jgi:hypothetical protein
MQSERLSPNFFSFLFAFILIAGQTLAQTESSIVTITVSGGTTPTFSWAPDSAIGRLIVEEGEEERWGTETDGANIYESPIRYGVHPPGASEDEPAFPLTAGHTYKVSLFRWLSVKPERFQLMGVQEFTPSADEPQKAEKQTLSGVRPTLRVSSLPSNFEFGGAMDGQAWWAAADSIADLITVEPEEGGIPQSRTVIKVLANQSEIIVGVRCYEREPDGIVSFSKARDSELGFSNADEADLGEEDHIVMVFDTFLDGRSGYVFAVNPTGAQYDGLVVEQGEEVNKQWDTVWEAKTSRDATGWFAEIRLPIKSLSFKKNLNTWGFNVQRRVQRLQETSRWSGANLDYEILQTSRAGLLTNLPDFDFGLGLSIRASTVNRALRPLPRVDAKYDSDLSLDVTQKVGSNLLSALTVNTDFAETEVDVRQINLTRFPTFFPEKRSFFLEGSDIFDFGLGLDEERLVPFFSRRIGLFGFGEDENVEVPINAGGKINGRMGNTNLGALVVNTRKVKEELVDEDTGFVYNIQRTTMGAVRIKQNILEESSLGMIATFGDPLDRSESWMAGMDFTYQTSTFLDEKNFLVGGWALFNDRKDLAAKGDKLGLKGDKSAFGVRVDYPNDLLDLNLTYTRIGDGFDPSLGFVPRNNIHILDFGGEFNPRPSWPFVRQMFNELSFTLFRSRKTDKWESYEMTIKPLDWLLESGDQINAGVTPLGDRPSQEFEIVANVDVAPGSYEFTRYFVGASSAQKRRISGQIKWEFGNYYTGDLSTVEASLALKLSALLTLEFSLERNSGTMMSPEDESIELFRRIFDEHLIGLRLQLNVSPNLQLSSLTQYDSESREFGSNNKLRWTFDPLGDLFIVYNHNMIRTRGVNKRWEFVSSQLPVKIQYAFRF